MSVNLIVAASLPTLADRLAALIAARPVATSAPEVLATEVVAVPSAGVESWLVDHLAGLPLGPTAGASVVAGIDFVFPSTVVQRALSRSEAGPQWPTIGQLTWAVYEVLRSDDRLAGAFATQPGASVLSRARSLADLFDRYLLHRPAMVRRWEQSGPDAPSGPAREQAELWLAVTDVLGVQVALAQQEAIGRLAAGAIDPELGERVWVFGISSLPALYREVLGALGCHRQVHLLAPVVSPVARARLVAAARQEASTTPDLRGVIDHRLVRTWAAGNLEDHLVLATIADTVEVVDDPAPVGGGLLAQVQAAVRADVDPRSGEHASINERDETIGWHRCYGSARQAEAVADIVRHLLEPTEGGAGLEFRDIAILCPDLATYAPLVQSAFAARDDVAAVPLVVTDLSLAASTPLVDTVVALVDMLDGRFRPAEVLAFAARPPVARRFGLGPADLDNLSELVASANVAWGFDDDQRARYLRDHGGLHVDGPLGSRTWAEGLAQLLAGITLADRPVHETSGLPVVPLSGIEDTATVVALASLARLVGTLARAIHVLGAPSGPTAWVDALADAVETLVELGDDDAWQWRSLERQLAAFRSDAGAAEGAVVAGADLAALFTSQLGGTGGRARFGSGAVTLTSLTGLRGVPHRVVVLMGLDGDLGVGGVRADDLLALDRLAGEPQPQREVRAQLLDAVLAAGQRLVITSTGIDPRSNKDVAPAVPLAELVALFDDTATDATGRPASTLVTVRHPRHAWSTPNFSAGSDAVVPGRRWGFDAPALAAARLREQGSALQTQIAGGSGHQFVTDAEPWAPFGPDPGLQRLTGEVSVEQLATALRNPAQAFLHDRVGVRLPLRRREAMDGLVPLTLSGLDRFDLLSELWELAGPGAGAAAADGGLGADGLTDGVLAAWRQQQAARGALPPEPYLADAVGDLNRRLRRLVERTGTYVGDRELARVPLTVHLTDGPLAVVVVGSALVAQRGAAGSRHAAPLVLDVRPSRPKAGDELAGLVTLAAVAAQYPGEAWQYLQLRLDAAKSDPVVGTLLTLADPDAAASVLQWAVDYRDHALAGFFPALCSTLGAVWEASAEPADRPASAALKAWGGSASGRGDFTSGDRLDAWVAVPGDTPEFDVLWDLAPTATEADWLGSPGVTWRCPERRIAVWAEQLWGRVEEFVVRVDP